MPMAELGGSLSGVSKRRPSSHCKGSGLIPVAVVDRWTVHRKNPSADLWNKMPEPILELQPPEGFFEPARKHLLEVYNLQPKAMTAPHVIYIDRQNTDRRMPNETHNGLIELLEGYHTLGQIEFRHVELEDLTPHQQIEAVAFADVRILSEGELADDRS